MSASAISKPYKVAPFNRNGVQRYFTPPGRHSIVPKGRVGLQEFRQQQLDTFRSVDSETDYALLRIYNDIALFYDSIASKNKSESQSLVVRPQHRRFEGDYNFRARGVLVIEDSLVQRKIICRSLATLGLILQEKWSFYEACTGEQALHILNDLFFDIVFVDQNLSNEGLKGSEVIKRLKLDVKLNKGRRILVIGVISNPAAHTKQLVMAGADLVYGKPIGNDRVTMKSLCEAIRHMNL